MHYALMCGIKSNLLLSFNADILWHIITNVTIFFVEVEDLT